MWAGLLLGLGPPHGPFSKNHSHESSSCHNPEWKRPEKGHGRAQASQSLLRSGPRQGQRVAAERREGALQVAGTGGTGRRPEAAVTQTCFCSATGQIRAMWAIPRPSNHYHQPLLSHLSYYKSIHKVTLITRFDSLTNPKGAPHPSSVSVHTHSPAGYTEAQRPRPSLLNPVSISPGYPGMLGFKRTRKGKCAQMNKGRRGWRQVPEARLNGPPKKQLLR